jgi:hypothetical protein
MAIQKQKENHLSVASDLFEFAKNNESFLKDIKTSDETWVCSCDSKTKQQSSQWNLLPYCK